MENFIISENDLTDEQETNIIRQQIEDAINKNLDAASEEAEYMAMNKRMW